MTIFGIYVSIHIPSIEKIQVYGGLQIPGGHPIVLLVKFRVEWHQNYVWGSIFDPNYDHFTKCKHLG